MLVLMACLDILTPDETQTLAVTEYNDLVDFKEDLLCFFGIFSVPYCVMLPYACKS